MTGLAGGVHGMEIASGGGDQLIWRKRSSGGDTRECACGPLAEALMGGGVAVNAALFVLNPGCGMRGGKVRTGVNAGEWTGIKNGFAVRAENNDQE